MSPARAPQPPPSVRTPVGAAHQGESMAQFWRRQHLRSVKATWRTFGIGRDLAAVTLRDPAWRAATRASMGLDNVFFPAWRDAVIEKPVFIVGHPRSGTSALWTRWMKRSCCSSSRR